MTSATIGSRLLVETDQIQLCRFALPGSRPRLGLLRQDTIFDLTSVPDRGLTTLDAALALSVSELQARLTEIPANSLQTYGRGHEADLLKPIESQEVWAAGVTYQISRDARIEESQRKDVYQWVYGADRPELFFKATGERTAGPNEPIWIRADSTWDAPEPELALVLNNRLEIVGYTIGNDVSSRSIEGENPLYLPQAKVYYGCCALGPAITPAWVLPSDTDFEIEMCIRRGSETVYEGRTSTKSMVRSFEHLIEYLGRDNLFPHGAILLTGTSLVPTSDFTLEGGEEVKITIDHIGILCNPVRRGAGKYVSPEQVIHR